MTVEMILAAALAQAPLQPAPAQPNRAPPSVVPPQAAAPSPTTPAPASPGAILETLGTDIVVQRDGTYVSTREMTALVVREDAIRSAAVIPIPVSTSLQSFELIEAWTDSADGKRLPIRPDQVMTQAPQYASDTATLSDVELKMLNFPQVGVGARVHFKLRVTQRTPFFPEVFTLEIGQSPWSALKAGSVTIDMPADMPLAIDMAGMTAKPPVTAAGRTQYSWAYSSGAFRAPEPGELAAIDGPIHLIASSLSGWNGLARAYQSRATPREQPGSTIKALAEELTKGIGDRRAQVAALAFWVQLRIRYINIVLGVGGFVPASAEDVLANRYGDCKGRATLLNALLAAKGIESSSVLINATGTYRAPTAAGQIFNHMINYVPSLDMFIDTTSPYTAFGDLPVSDRDKFVVITRTGETRRTPVNGPAPDRYVSDYALTVNLDGSIDGTSVVTPSGGYVADMRGLGENSGSRDPAELASTMMLGNGVLGSGTVTIPPPRAPLAQMKMTARWRADDALNTDGLGALRVPYGVSLTTIGGIGVGASRPRATVPAQCSPTSLIETFSITFPAELTIIALPKAAKVETGTIHYASDWSREGQTVRVLRSYSSTYPSRACAPDMLAQVQAAKRVIAKDVAAQIVYARKGVAIPGAT